MTRVPSTPPALPGSQAAARIHPKHPQTHHLLGEPEQWLRLSLPLGTYSHQDNKKCISLFLGDRVSLTQGRKRIPDEGLIPQEADWGGRQKLGLHV